MYMVSANTGDQERCKHYYEFMGELVQDFVSQFSTDLNDLEVFEALFHVLFDTHVCGSC